jgi:hypothetical protein
MERRRPEPDATARLAPVALTALTALTALVALGGCQSQEPDETVPPPPASLGRWTDAFAEPALVVADVVVIEGPPALRAHFALPQDAARIVIDTRATDRGLLQVATAKVPGTELTSQLDNWTVVALRRLEVLERPGETAVRIVARGDAVWRPMDGDESRTRRGQELVLEGELVR